MSGQMSWGRWQLSFARVNFDARSAKFLETSKLSCVCEVYLSRNLRLLYLTPKLKDSLGRSVSLYCLYKTGDQQLTV